MGEQMGHGVKQRDKVRMTDEEVEAFLNERHSMTMSTLNADGSIHSIGMWYGFLEGEIGLESKAKAQKILNLRRNPNITLLVEEGDYYEELRGVSIVGTAEIVEDPDRIWELGVSVFSRYSMPYTEALRPAVEMMLNKRVVIKVTPKKIVTWDHRKLGLPSTRPPQQ
ncbi:pyridoxamine 5'-phosphate oxidase family protein [Yinghuangia seranimata]|uniref:pyridoxamine 5'-phosphate oxidase family protein n=1 Tax=Yinghuangia seranimata TaxID=408067 RepID=UPI00248CDB25|nr:PPOX class F420-dependent oxidoreductase [Yinghuangia seranimata]MDI2131803.1 PPOX class F420-dependent oxidoreductase [Yinghuangia seranimata]